MKGITTSGLEAIERLNDADRFSFSTLFANGFETYGATSLARLRDLLHFEHAVASTDEGLKATRNGQYFHVWRTPERHHVDEYINNNGVAEPSCNESGEQKSYLTHHALLDVIDRLGASSVGSFDAGCTLENISQVVYSSETLSFYSWRGDYPKVVPPGSSPETTGGIGPECWVGISDLTFRNQLGSPEGASYMGYAISKALEGQTVEAKLNHLVFVEDFKHLVTEDGDWKPAAQAALNHARVNKFNKVWSFRPMAFKSPLVVVGWGEALELRLSKVVAHDSVPMYQDWKDARALITIGAAQGGSMVGLNVDIGFLDGKGVCSGIEVVGDGCGGSRINVDRAVNCNIVYDCRKQTWPAASNFVSGKYWQKGNLGVFLARGPQAKKEDLENSPPSIAEGHKLCVGFVTQMRYGAYLLRDGAQYSQISGDADFNGRYLSEVTLSGLSFSGLERGAAITNGTATGEVLAFYEQTAGVYKVLIIEAHDASKGKSSYAAGDILTSGGWSSTVSKVRTAQDDNNFFFDIILDFQGSPFAKIDVDCGYLGGIVGSSLHSCSINYKNAFEGHTNMMNGATFVHSGKILTLKDAYLNRMVFDCTEDYIANGTHLFTRHLRTYGSEYFALFEQDKTIPIRTFAYGGSIQGSGTKDVYDVQVFGPLGVNGVCASFKVAVAPNGLEIYDSTITSGSKLVVSAEGMTLMASQSALPKFFIYFTFNRR